MLCIYVLIWAYGQDSLCTHAGRLRGAVRQQPAAGAGGGTVCRAGGSLHTYIQYNMIHALNVCAHVHACRAYYRLQSMSNTVAALSVA
jgi:hypothetical protein